jgi:hypothetical protein
VYWRIYEQDFRNHVFEDDLCTGPPTSPLPTFAEAADGKAGLTLSVVPSRPQGNQGSKLGRSQF